MIKLLVRIGLLGILLTACGGNGGANPTSATNTSATNTSAVQPTQASTAASTSAPATAVAATEDPCPTAPSQTPDTIAQLAKAVDVGQPRLELAYAAIPIDTRGSSGQAVPCVRPAVRGGIGVQVTLSAKTVKALYAACGATPGADDPWVEVVCGESSGSTTDAVQAALLFVDLEPDAGKPFTFHSASFFVNHTRADGSPLNLSFLPGDRSRIIGTKPGDSKSEYVDAVALRFLSPTGTDGAVMIVFSPDGTYLPAVTALGAGFQPRGTSAFGFEPNPSIGPDSPLPWLQFAPAELP